MDRKRQDKELVKALYKYMLKNYHRKSGDKSTTKDIVEDILDPDHHAEVDPDRIPGNKRSVMSKSKKGKNKASVDKAEEPPKPPKAKKPMRLQNRPRIKGVKRLKNYMKKAHGDKSC